MTLLIQSTLQEERADPLRSIHSGPLQTIGMFDTHSDNPSSRPSTDLVFAAQRLRQFLSLVHNSEHIPRGSLYYPNPTLTAAVKRYASVWLPLVASYGHRGAPQLAAPLDVAWVWHLHRLDPGAYRRDCELAFGFVVPQTGDCPFETAGRRGQQGTGNCLPEAESLARSEWSKFAPSEPFDIDNLGILSQSSGRDLTGDEFDNAAKLQLTFDVGGSAGRQGGFLWQVSDPIYNDCNFLQHALERYLMLTKLWQIHTGKMLVPTYDMDLMWHAHMSFPVKYKNDMIRLVGREVAHDDSITDRSPDGDNTRYANHTAALWSQTFPGTSWAERRCMWRGDPPLEYWAQLPTTKEKEQCPTGGLPVCEGFELTSIPHQSRKLRSPSANPYLVSDASKPASSSRASVSLETAALAASDGPVQLGEHVYYAMPTSAKKLWFRQSNPAIKGFVDSRVLPPFGRSPDPKILYCKIPIQRGLKGGQQISFELCEKCLLPEQQGYHGRWASCTAPDGLPDSSVYLVCPVDTRRLGLQKRTELVRLLLFLLFVVSSMFSFLVVSLSLLVSYLYFGLLAVGMTLIVGAILLATLWSRGVGCFSPYESGELLAGTSESKAASSCAGGCGGGAGCGGNPFRKPAASGSGGGGGGCGGGGCGGGCGGGGCGG